MKKTSINLYTQELEAIAKIAESFGLDANEHGVTSILVRRIIRAYADKFVTDTIEKVREKYNE